jgi:large subunit ribosomal protein L4
VHGPKPRTYEYALPKKMLLGALRSALSAKLAEQKLIVVDAWSLDTHKTKALRAALDKLNAEKTALLVAHGDNRNLELASRNLDGVKLSATNVLQPYDVLRHDRLVVSKDAAARLVRALDPDRQPAETPHVESIAPAPAPPKEAAPKAAGKPAAKRPAAKKTATRKGKE